MKSVISALLVSLAFCCIADAQQSSVGPCQMECEQTARICVDSHQSSACYDEYRECVHICADREEAPPACSYPNCENHPSHG